jgi:hypothetical protein
VTHFSNGGLCGLLEQGRADLAGLMLIQDDAIGGALQPLAEPEIADLQRLVTPPPRKARELQLADQRVGKVRI